jgi:hypothetical protein
MAAWIDTVVDRKASAGAFIPVDNVADTFRRINLCDVAGRKAL